ncbi:hypothetical protein AVEN_123669-1 [Araneus ventricosus]|uniref:DDE-1 domain-containing protein n=1 Tax=Araneus ventricosus TaxID=182803 RepID=A0A4Y2I200_ARAVE|nr:hypothetical protein AVEN_243302-1 [Araneus ventricosus]GBM71598.1 hypothetical protein AVEN_123669-1 [Araneus ventricosus]
MYSNTSVFVCFHYCRFFPGKICLGFRRLPWISSACLRDLVVSDKSEAEKSAYETKNLKKAEGFISQQVFNCDETGLLSKKMPNTMFITQEEKALQGHNTLKNGLTLFFVCGDVSGDCKVKPLLVYHSKTPSVYNELIGFTLIHMEIIASVFGFR